MAKRKSVAKRARSTRRMVEGKSVAKRAAEALLGDDRSALTVGGGVLFDVFFKHVREVEQRRSAGSTKKRKPWADALAKKLVADHPDVPLIRLCDGEYLPHDDGEGARRYAGFEVWLGVDEKNCKVLHADKHGATATLKLSAFRTEYLGPARQRLNQRSKS